MNYKRALGTCGAAALTLVLASACGSDSESPSATDDSASVSSADDAASAAPADEASAVSIEDPWVKSAESGMTAAFGTLVNGGDDDITVVSAASDITDYLELHETVANDAGAMVMQPKEGGFTIPGGGTHELDPGGDHLMVMDLTRALEPGEDVSITLTMADGSTKEVVATVKDFDGADEEYQDGDTGDQGGMDMGDEPTDGSGSEDQ